MKSFEIWAGVESTVNRVNDRYRDQIVLSGHQYRIADLHRFAELGIKAIRYPVLWERVAPGSLNDCDWTWSDERLARLRELDVRPIVGLLHHGSGPRYTDLLDAEFPETLANYARKVAERYPWVDAYTPVNEPLTTARFSALYGLWYPHRADDRSFCRALLNQIKGTILAMRAIREVNPKAHFIQTEDLAKVFATPAIQYQADFENERRWLTFDLLCGTVRKRPLAANYLRRFGGISREELAWFEENASPPDICGFNHYLSSERFLDERVELYPGCTVGGNGCDRYVDVLAARVLPEGIAGANQLLREAWERFGLPLALTEVHNGCTREEQLRWLVEQYRHCRRLREQGVDVRAMTVWSLLGAVDWNSLLTQENNCYEPGAFDIRSPEPRPTAIAHVTRNLAHGEEPQHPLLESSGWWHRHTRFLPAHAGGKLLPFPRRKPEPLLITGGRGTLGKACARLCCSRGIEHILLTRPELDIADERSVMQAVERYRPWAIINAAGYVRVDEAECESERCFRENTVGAANLARACADRNIRCVTFSTDLVFDGSKRSPYVESDEPNPLNVYGVSKLHAEREVLALCAEAMVVRSSAFFGPWDSYNFVNIALRTLARGHEFHATDGIVSPTYVPDLVHAVLDLLIDGESGVFHLANQGEITWYELARRAAEFAGVDASRLRRVALDLPAPRPAYSALASERAWIMPQLEAALARYFQECEAPWKEESEEPLAA